MGERGKQQQRPEEPTGQWQVVFVAAVWLVGLLGVLTNYIHDGLLCLA